MQELNRVSIDPSVYEQYCCLRNCFSKQKQKAQIIKIKRLNSKGINKKQTETGKKQKSDLKPIMAIVKNKTNPKFTKYLGINKNKNAQQTSKQKIKISQTHTFKNINGIKQTTKPNILFQSNQKPFYITINNTNDHQLSNSYNQFIQFSHTNLKKQQISDYYKDDRSNIFLKKNIFDNSIGQSTKLLQSYNNYSPNITPFHQKQQFNVLNSIFTNIWQMTPPFKQSIVQDKHQDYQSSKIINNPERGSHKSQFNIKQKSPEKKNLCDFRQIKTIISSKNQGSGSYSIEKSEVVYKNSGRVTSFGMKKKLQQHFDQAHSQKMVKQSSQNSQMRNKKIQQYKQLFYSKEDSNQFIKKIEVEVLNESFNSQSINNSNRTQVYQFNKIISIYKDSKQEHFIIKNKSTQQLFLLKEISKQAISQQQKLKWERQKIISLKLKHQNILSLLQVQQNNLMISLIYEYPDTNLLQLLHNNKFIPQQLAIYYLKSIIKGIQYLHSKSIIHRNIKPENILIIQNSCKISNFKHAINLQQHQFTNSSYLPPQIQHKYSQSHKIDSWAVGIIAYQMIYGKIPFNQQVISNNKKQLQFQQNFQIYQSYKQLIIDLLQFNQKKRINMKQALTYACFL